MWNLKKMLISWIEDQNNTTVFSSLLLLLWWWWLLFTVGWGRCHWSDVRNLLLFRWLLWEHHVLIYAHLLWNTTTTQYKARPTSISKPAGKKSGTGEQGVFVRNGAVIFALWVPRIPDIGDRCLEISRSCHLPNPHLIAVPSSLYARSKLM